LDRPLALRYLDWLVSLIKGDWGHAYSLQRPVIDEVLERSGPTLLLSGAALSIASVLGLLAGAIAAAHHGRWPDRVLTTLVLLGISTPAFWLAILFVLVFGVWLGAFPVSGMAASDGANAGSWLDVAHH